MINRRPAGSGTSESIGRCRPPLRIQQGVDYTWWLNEKPR
jgi:hypothetical protein